MLSLLGLLTRIPGLTADLERAARQTWTVPAIGLIIGGLVFLAVGALQLVVPDQWLLAVAGVIILYQITGLIHLDGLGDVADARMALDAEQVLKDPRLGIGGTYAVAMAILLLIILLRLHIERHTLEAVILGEVGAKLTMLTTLRFGKAREEGMARAFIDETNGWRFAIAIVLGSGVVLVISLLAVLLVPIAVAIGIVMAISHNRRWGFVNGDVVGASNEIGRIICLLALLVIL